MTSINDDNNRNGSRVLPAQLDDTSESRILEPPQLATDSTSSER